MRRFRGGKTTSGPIREVRAVGRGGSKIVTGTGSDGAGVAVPDGIDELDPDPAGCGGRARRGVGGPSVRCHRHRRSTGPGAVAVPPSVLPSVLPMASTGRRPLGSIPANGRLGSLGEGVGDACGGAVEAFLTAVDGCDGCGARDELDSGVPERAPDLEHRIARADHGPGGRPVLVGLRAQHDRRLDGSLAERERPELGVAESALSTGQQGPTGSSPRKRARLHRKNKCVHAGVKGQKWRHIRPRTEWQRIFPGEGPALRMYLRY